MVVIMFVGKIVVGETIGVLLIGDFVSCGGRILLKAILDSPVNLAQCDFVSYCNLCTIVEFRCKDLVVAATPTDFSLNGSPRRFH